MPLPQTSTNQLLASVALIVGAVPGIRSVSSTYSGLIGPDQQPHATLWITSHDEERKAYGGNQYLETAGHPAGTPEVQSSGETLTVTFDLPRAAVEGQGVYLHAELSTRIRQEFRA